MAKKSAVSKGYRKQAAKKPYLSKRDIAIVCVIVALVAVGAFFLFRYDDGALKVKDGAVVTEGDNWLIANGSNARGGARYYRLGEIGEIDGCSREKGAHHRHSEKTHVAHDGRDGQHPHAEYLPFILSQQKQDQEHQGCFTDQGDQQEQAHFREQLRGRFQAVQGVHILYRGGHRFSHQKNSHRSGL